MHVSIANAIGDLAELVRAFPRAALEAGAGLWADYERSIEQFNASWPVWVDERVDALEHSRKLVLDQGHHVPVRIRCRFDWHDFLEMMRARQRAKGDLASTKGKRVYLDHFRARCRVESHRAARDEKAEWKSYVDPKAYDLHRPRADFFIVGVLRAELEDLGRCRRPADYWRIAIALLVAEALEIRCLDLGLGREIPCEAPSGEESRQYISRLARQPVPPTVALQRYSDLATTTAASLRRICGVPCIGRGDSPGQSQAMRGFATTASRGSVIPELESNQHRLLLCLELVGATSPSRPASIGVLYRHARVSKRALEYARDQLRGAAKLGTVPCVGAYLTEEGQQMATSIRRQYGIWSLEQAMQALGVHDAIGFEEAVQAARQSGELTR